MPDGVGLAGESGPGLGFLGGDGAGLALVAAEHANLVEQLRVVDFTAHNRLARQRAHEFNGLFTGQELVMLAGECAHGVGTGGSTVGGSDGRAIELGNLEQVLAGPQLALELAELLDGLIDLLGLHALGGFCHGRLGLLIEFLSHTISLISQAARHTRRRGQFA